jgi:UDP-GlcNAc:undecaprenyl-phosphate/decaprenyl-phosphate GlcNAc-1-phosphate transferase
MRDLALNCINAFLLSVVLVLLMEKFAGRIGLVDVPTLRKNHDGLVPLAGGALFVAFAVAAVLLEQRPEGSNSFLLGLMLLVLLGVVDDLRDVRASIKLAAQFVCVALMVLPSQTFIWNFGTILGEQPGLPTAWAAPVTIIAAVGLVNALNMIDGVDGLAGSLSVVALFWFAIAAGLVGLSGEQSFALLGAFCVVGFLVFNLRHPWRKHASVFLGDSGSMMLGALLAFLAIALSQRHDEAYLSPIAPLWICAIPIIDTLSLACRRLAAGRSPFASDRCHLHHLMLDAGFTVNQVVGTLSAVSVVFGAVGVLGWYFGLPDAALLVGLIGPVIFHAWFVLYGLKHLTGTWAAVEQVKSSIGPQLLLK